MITNIRVLSQQLSTSQFDQPKELVKWMGAIQAQEYNMAKWAIGARLKSGSLQQVEESLKRGEIIRTHIMRPTWHFVPAEDLRWMSQLSGHRVKDAYDSYARKFGIPESTHTTCSKLFEIILRDNNHLTKQEISNELNRAGVLHDPHIAHYFINRAEAMGLICSGIDKNKKITYALLDERIPPTKELHKDEALAELARRYFRSHSPASLQDFLWWSGLTITETRKAINLISTELNKDRFASQELFVHQSWVDHQPCDDVLHFLPPFDEYLISYKDRSAALNPKHYPKAFNNFGTFYPVILHNGKIIGNWEKVTKKGEVTIETTFFEKGTKVEKKLLEEAEKKYSSYLSNT